MEADGPTAIDAVAAHNVVRLRGAVQRGSAEDVEWLLATRGRRTAYDLEIDGIVLASETTMRDQSDGFDSDGYWMYVRALEC
jgi:hypothetical protein